MNFFTIGLKERLIINVIAVIVLLLIVRLNMSTLSLDPTKNIQLVKTLATQIYGGNQVLADLTVAQAILESDLSNPKKPSDLAFKYNNLFGIKERGTAGTITLPTTEYIHGKPQKVMGTFAYNKSIEDSIEQRKTLFQQGTHAHPNNYFKVLSAQTFEDAAKALTTAPEPFATNPHYAQLLISVYNEYIKDKNGPNN